MTLKRGDIVELNEQGELSPYANYTWEVTERVESPNTKEAHVNLRDITFGISNNYPESFLRKVSFKQKKIKLLLYSGFYL